MGLFLKKVTRKSNAPSSKKKKFLKKFKISKIFPKKEKNFQKKKKKKNLWTRDIGLPSDFFKKGPFFYFKDFKNL